MPMETLTNRRGHGPDLALDVLDIEAGAQDPAPGRELLDEGLFGLEAVRVVFPLPDVLDVGLVPVAEDVGELDEDADAAGVLEVGDVPAVEIGPVGMHDHPDAEIGDPEIILAFVAVAESANALGRGSLRFVERDAAGPGLGVILGQDARSDVGQLPDGVPLALEEPLLEGRDEHPEEKDDEQRDGQRRRQEDAQEEGPPARTGHVPVSGGLAGDRTAGRSRSLFQEGIPELPPQRQGHLHGGFRRARQARPMVVAAGADHEPVPRGQGDELAAEALGVSGVKGLEAVEAPSPVLFDERLEGGEVGARPGHDRMGEDGQPARAVEDPDGLGRRDGSRHGLGQERLQGLVLRVEPVAEDVLLPGLAVDDGQLDAGDEADPFLPRGFAEGGQTVDGVVVGQGRGPDPGRRQPVGQLGRSEVPVAELGMAVKIDAEEFGHGALSPLPGAAQP